MHEQEPPRAEAGRAGDMDLPEARDAAPPSLRAQSEPAVRCGAGATWLVALALLPAMGGCRREPAADARGSAAEPSDSAGAEQRVQCGSNLCAVGEVCCNPSCSICTVPDGMCTQQFCDESPAPEARAGERPADSATPSCDTTQCDPGMHCELEPVQCVRAPCDAVPTCKPDAPQRPAKDDKSGR